MDYTTIKNCVRIVWNALLSLGRLRRCCLNKKDDYKRTNCDDTMISDSILPRKIVSWNIQGLFLYMGQDKTDNIIERIRKMDGDIVCLQEVFEDELRYEIIKRLSDIYPYYLCGNLEKRYIVGEDSGLLVLSTQPIHYQNEVILEDYVFPDRMANKSILYFESYQLNFAMTHLQSSSIHDRESLSKKQIDRIVERSIHKKMIVCGDLNHTSANDILSIDRNNDVPTCNDDILDYILPINYDHFKIVPYVPIFDLARTSDHRPIIGYLSP